MIESRNENKPSWRVRRRFFAYTIAFASSVMVYVMIRWDDILIATELIAFSTAVWLAVLGFYTTGATYEDIKLFRKNKETDYDEEYK